MRYIDEEDLKVLTEDGFIERYRQERARHKTGRTAYEAVESVYIGIVGKRRYRSANAFRQALYRRRKKT